MKIVKCFIEFVLDPGQVIGAFGRHDDGHGGRDEELHGRLRRDHQQVPRR